jgi:tetratricopeptide (TPR) repeat protein
MSNPFMAATSDPLSGKRLDSWKEIATFLGRAERTVKRWETERGLPVHRVPGGGRSAVFAYSDELTEWLKGYRQEIDTDDSTSGESQEGKPEGYKAELDATAATQPVPAPIVVVKSWPPSRLAAWLVPFVLAGILLIVFTSAHRPFQFKALASRHAPNPEAQDLYLKGRYYWDRRTPDDLNKAIDFFTQAIVKDPSDAQAYVGLADSYNLLREFGAMPNSEAYPRALSAAQRAVELDDSSAEAHISLAFGTYWWLWHGVTAEREFKRAIELDPKSVRAHHWYATYLFGMKRFPEAIDQMEQARRLEPSSNAILADKGVLLWDAGRNNEGIALLAQIESTEPSLSSTHAYLSRIYWQQKDYAKSLAESRRVSELRHDEVGLKLSDVREKGFASSGLHGLYENELPLQKDLVDRGAGNAYRLATVYATLGKKPEAVACLQTSFDRHEAAMLMGDPIPELQNDPEFQKFRTQVMQLLTQ